MQAIDFIYERLHEDISVYYLKQLHSLLFRNAPYVTASWNPDLKQHVNKSMVPGRFKQLPNSVLKRDGTMHNYVDPLQVEPQMEELVQFVNDTHSKVHPIERSAIAHYNLVRIHPFDDGNGRLARLLMNMVLLKYGYPPCVIHTTDRVAYYDSLEAADSGDLSSFACFVADQIVKTYNEVVSDMRHLVK
jgi:Fic family protein